MYFTDQREPFRSLVIQSDKDSLKAKPTTLPVYEPVVVTQSSTLQSLAKFCHIPEWSEATTKECVDLRSGASSCSKVLTLRSSLHDVKDIETVFALPNQHLCINGGSLKIPSSRFGGVSLHDRYWVWTEDVLAYHADVLQQARIYSAVHASLFTYVCNNNILQSFLELWCPSTNTLHTKVGEFSISLIDLRALGGLPIQGDFFDEVVPTAPELLSDDTPQTCKYLFTAYHMLPKTSDGVLISDWINFWFQGPGRYLNPPLRSNRKKRENKPRFSHNPCGNIDKHLLPRSKDYDDPFKAFEIDADIKDGTYLAAFLSCWLCNFVLPRHGSCRIRAIVFRMARGDCFSLAVPVLASIYRGLRDISASKDLAESTAILPIHYVYSWFGCHLATHFYSKIDSMEARMVKYAGENMARHFDLEAAREVFHKASPSSLRLLSLLRRHIPVIDSANISATYKDVLVSFRSSYMTFRRGKEIIVEAYSPHRFSRQYGFCQDIPGNLRKEILTCDLKELGQLWQSSTLLGTSSKFTIPGNVSSPPLASKEYVD